MKTYGTRPETEAEKVARIKASEAGFDSAYRSAVAEFRKFRTNPVRGSVRTMGSIFF